MDINDIYKWLETAGQYTSESKVDLAINLIEEELEELKEAWSNGNRTEFLDAIIDLYWVVTNAAFFVGEPVQEVMSYANKVSVSNWSKFCLSEIEAIHTVQAYKEGTHPDKLGQNIECYYENNGQFWIVKRTDGKILKSINYLHVNDIK